MKKNLIVPLLAAVSFLACAFTLPAAPAKAEDASMSVKMITDFTSDGSGDLSAELTMSPGMMALMKSYPGFDKDNLCSSFMESSYDAWEMTEQENDGALTCIAKTTFADLGEYKDLILGNYSGARFTRLEIKDGHLYYDLMPNMAGSSVFGELGQGLGFNIEVYWILKMPGEVVDSNATETSGQTLTWNVLEMNTSSHIQAESKTGGGLDPTLMILAGLGLLLCCGLVVVIAAVIVFIVLRKKKAPSAE